MGVADDRRAGAASRWRITSPPRTRSLMSSRRREPTVPRSSGSRPRRSTSGMPAASRDPDGHVWEVAHNPGSRTHRRRQRDPARALSPGLCRASVSCGSQHLGGHASRGIALSATGPAIASMPPRSDWAVAPPTERNPARDANCDRLPGLTPVLLLRQERGHQAQADRGFPIGRYGSASRRPSRAARTLGSPGRRGTESTVRSRPVRRVLTTSGDARPSFVSWRDEPS